jgi:MFS family permease
MTPAEAAIESTTNPTMLVQSVTLLWRMRPTACCSLLRCWCAVSAIVSGWIMVGLVLVYVAFFALGSGPVTWVLLAEVLPPRIKGPAASLATAAGWAGAACCGPAPGGRGGGAFRGERGWELHVWWHWMAKVLPPRIKGPAAYLAAAAGWASKTRFPLLKAPCPRGGGGGGCQLMCLV